MKRHLALILRHWAHALDPQPQPLQRCEVSDHDRKIVENLTFRLITARIAHEDTHEGEPSCVTLRLPVDDLERFVVLAGSACAS